MGGGDAVSARSRLAALTAAIAKLDASPAGRAGWWRYRADEIDAECLVTTAEVADLGSALLDEERARDAYSLWCSRTPHRTALPPRPRREATPPTVRLPGWARWEEDPQDAGQIVQRRYSTDGEYLYQRYQRAFDRLEPPERYSYVRRRLSKKVDLERDYDPANGAIPRTVGKWQKVVVIG